jgi:hypothetical protein
LTRKLAVINNLFGISGSPLDDQIENRCPNQ